MIVGQGASARPDGDAVLALAAQAAQKLGGLSDGWNGFSVLHTAAARVGALDLGFTPAAGGLDAQAMAKAGALDLDLQPRRRRNRHRAGRLRGLYRHAWRPRRASRRRHPAGGGLHRKIGPLCEYGRPRAARLARRLPAGRGPRGLGDPARAVGAFSAMPLPFNSLAELRRQARRRASALRAHRSDRAGIACRHRRGSPVIRRSP